MEHVVLLASKNALTVYILCEENPSTASVKSVASKKAVKGQVADITRTHSMLSVRSLFSNSEDPS